jgi:hypothetical protein
VAETSDKDVERAVLTGIKGEESSLYRAPLSEAAWNEALNLARSGLREADSRFAASIVARIDRAITWLDPVMSRFCELTCPTCEDPCCHGKRIFFNLADLLVLTTRNTWIPPGQTRSTDGESCRYLTAAGCALERTHRPYVCVWFLCEPQVALLQGETARFQRDFLHALKEIREGRLTLEGLFGEVGGR